jgi:hypothetical protein
MWMAAFNVWFLMLAPCSKCPTCPCGPPAQSGDYDGQIILLPCD